jgi:hypothetical protein
MAATPTAVAKEFDKHDLRAEWKKVKKQLLNATKLSDAGRKKVAAAVKKFDAGTGALLDKHAKEIEKLPGSAQKVKSLFDEIEKKLLTNKTLIVDAVDTNERKIAESFMSGVVLAFKSALNNQRKFFEKVSSDKSFFAEKDAPEDKSMGTEEQAKALIKELKESLSAMNKKLVATREQMEKLDKMAHAEAKGRSDGDAMGAQLAKAGARADSADAAARAAPLFRKRLSVPKVAVQRKVAVAVKFLDTELKTWSKKRGRKLGSIYDLAEAIKAGQAFVSAGGGTDAEMLEFIRSKTQTAEIGRMLAKIK